MPHLAPVDVFVNMVGSNLGLNPPSPSPPLSLPRAGHVLPSVQQRLGDWWII